jgi:hypothetical protein
MDGMRTLTWIGVVALAAAAGCGGGEPERAEPVVESGAGVADGGGSAASEGASDALLEEHVDEESDDASDEPAIERALLAARTELAPEHPLAVLLELDRACGELGEKIQDEEQRLDHLAELPAFLLAVGEHRRALAVDAEYRKLSGEEPAERTDAPPFGERTPSPAREVLLAAAQGRRLVFFGEDAVSCRARALLLESLADFAEAGFTHLSLEALDAAALDSLATHGAIMLDQGVRLREPLQAALVHRARELGMTVFGHDRVHRDVMPLLGIADRTSRANHRAECAALHLADLLDAEPNARVVVLASREHVRERAAGKLVPVAARLSKYEPLTIDAASHVECAERAFESNAFHHATERALLTDHAAVFVDASGAPWTARPGTFDFDVFFPRAEYPDELGGRPGWLAFGDRRPVSSLAIQLQVEHVDRTLDLSPLYFRARSADSRREAVALDGVIDRTGPNVPPLLLSPGVYEFESVDRSGSVVLSGKHTVE